MYGFAAYGLWGIVPLYFKAISFISPREILAHRVVWSAILLFLLLAVMGKLPGLWSTFRSGSVLRQLALSSLLIGTNWYVFIYSVVSGQIMQGSLGYFLLPLVNVLIGTVFFQERMRPVQWLALAIAMVGALNLIVQIGVFPWIAVTLAFSFSFYGVVRKYARVEGTTALTVETILLSPIALGYLIFLGSESALVFGNVDRTTDGLVILSGLVTSVPLIFFAQAVQRLRLITIGFLQFISPSLAFMLAVFRYGEEFTPVHQVSYGLIWAALVLFVMDAIGSRKPRERVQAA
jgi:chloramphenicol-sensitive protein RarD